MGTKNTWFRAGSILNKAGENLMQKNELEKYEKLISPHFKKKKLKPEKFIPGKSRIHLQFLHMVQPRLWNL